MPFPRVACFLVAVLHSCLMTTTFGSRQQRWLLAEDTWATAPACSEPLMTSSSQGDTLGRLWGYESGQSCAFKDEQQQALSLEQRTTPQTWSSAPTCPHNPTPGNSAPDSLDRLWGVWWGKSCAFKSVTGEPSFYASFKTAAANHDMSLPVPAHLNLNSSTILPQLSGTQQELPTSLQQGNPSKNNSSSNTSTSAVARATATSAQRSDKHQHLNTLQPLPNPTLHMPVTVPLPKARLNVSKSSASSSILSSPSMMFKEAPSPVPVDGTLAINQPSPATAAVRKNAAAAPVITNMTNMTCSCPSELTTGDADKLARVIAENLWLRLTGRDSLRDSIKAAARNDPPLNTSAGVSHQQQQVEQLSSLMAAIQELTQQALKSQPVLDNASASIQAAETDTTQTAVRPSQTRSKTDDSAGVVPQRPSNNTHIFDHLDAKVTAPALLAAAKNSTVQTAAAAPLHE